MSHGKLPKKKWGNFAKNEIALLGDSCENMERLALSLMQNLQAHSLLYIDGDHSEDAGFEPQTIVIGEKSSSIKTNVAISASRLNALYPSLELAIINGHHFPGGDQILLYNPSKKGSMLRRKQELSNVVAIYADLSEEDAHNYFDEVFSRKDVMILRSEEELLSFILKKYLQPPLLRALILAGGRSERMGMDKAMISYHGVPQFEYLMTQFRSLGLEVSISCRQDQVSFFQEKNVDLVVDRFSEIGAVSGIASALMLHDNSAFFVVACDMPAVNTDVILELMAERDFHSLATGFFNEEKKWIEPLCAIWEPSSLSVILQELALNKTCPRKMLMSHNVKMITPSSPSFVANANHPAEMEEWMKQINQSSK